MRVAVTGASGFVGTAVCQALLAAGDEVIRVVRRPDGHAGSRVVGSFDVASLESALAGCDAVVHAASVVHRRGAPLEEYVAFNVRGTAALCEAARTAGVRRFVFLSSVKVYGEGALGRVTEETPVASDPGYASTKLQAEEIVQHAGFSNGACSLRLSPVFGVGDKGNVRSMIVHARRRTLAVPGSGDAHKSLVHVGKVAEAVTKAVHGEARGVFLVADPEAPTMRQLADTITRSLGRRPAPSLPIAPFALVARVLDAAARRLGRPPPGFAGLVQKSQQQTVFDPSLYERTFGHSLHVDLEEAVREEVAWLRCTGVI